MIRRHCIAGPSDTLPWAGGPSPGKLEEAIRAGELAVNYLAVEYRNKRNPSGASQHARAADEAPHPDFSRPDSPYSSFYVRMESNVALAKQRRCGSGRVQIEDEPLAES
jgi:hypothetical protein